MTVESGCEKTVTPPLRYYESMCMQPHNQAIRGKQEFKTGETLLSMRRKTH